MNKSHIWRKLGWLLALTGMLLPFGALARIPEETHAILQNLAQVTYKDIKLPKDALGMKLPQDWTNRIGEQGGIAYFDPRNPDVLGSVFLLDGEPSEADILSELGKRFVTTWTVSDRQTEETVSGLPAEVYVLEGRVVGEETRLLVGVLHVTPQKSAFVIASAPETWYRSYEPVFMDILKSVTKL